MAAKSQKEICITPGCDKTAHRRGLCDSCYFSARKLVLNKTVSGWNWLVKQGLALAPKRKPFMAAVSRKIRAAKPAKKRGGKK